MKRKLLKSRFETVFLCLALMLCVFPTELSAQPALRSGQTVITQIYNIKKAYTVNRDKNQSLSLPQILDCDASDGTAHKLAVEWVCDDYRSYKEGTFIFTAVFEDKSYVFKDSSLAEVTVKNAINGDFNINTTRRYYFDHKNDLLDFDCYFTEKASSAKNDYIDVSLSEKNISDYWSIADGMAKSTHSRSINTGWNGINRASDLSTVLLNGIDFYNFRLEIEYCHGSDWWYPYVLFGVQDPTVFFGNIYAPYNADTETGAGTDLHYDNNTLKGGVYTTVETEGALAFYGAIKTDAYGRLFFDRDISENKTVFSGYNRNLKHCLKITAVDGTAAIQLDDSDIFYAEIDDEALGGLVGFASSGNGVAYDNFTLTALDENGNEVSFEKAEHGFAPDFKTDNYTGWDSAKRPWTYNWILGYDQTR